jgi:hypothetical protein
LLTAFDQSIDSNTAASLLDKGRFHSFPLEFGSSEGEYPWLPVGLQLYDAPGVLNSKESDIARRELSKESQLGSKPSFLMFDRTFGVSKMHFHSDWAAGRFAPRESQESRNQSFFVCFWIFLDIQLRCFKSECQTWGLIWTLSANTEVRFFRAWTVLLWKARA